MLAYEKLIFTRSDNHLHLINIILEIGNIVLSHLSTSQNRDIFRYWIVTFSSFLVRRNDERMTIDSQIITDIQFLRNTVDSLKLSISWISI